MPRGLFWGVITGFTSFVSHSGGPPYQVYALPLKMTKTVFAGTSTIAFAIINAVKTDDDFRILSTPQVLTTDNEDERINTVLPRHTRQRFTVAH